MVSRPSVTAPYAPSVMRYLFTLLLALTFTVSYGQELVIPEVTYVSPSDYLDQQEKVLEVIDYLQYSPANAEQEKRKEAMAFLIQWLEGSPTVSVTLEGFITPFMAYGESLAIFLGGYTKYVLQTGGDNPDPVMANLAGTERVVEYYLANQSVYGRHKELDKLVKQREKGRLRRWVEKSLS